jgi:hypothetical protein
VAVRALRVPGRMAFGEAVRLGVASKLALTYTESYMAIVIQSFGGCRDHN